MDKYAVHFDPALRDQVVARYKKLNLPTYFAGVYSMLTATGSGTTVKVQMTYPSDPAKQYLFFGSMYDEGLKQAVSAGPKWPAPKQK